MPQTIYKLECEDAIAFICEAKEGFAELNEYGTFTWINPAYEKILNAPTDLILGTDWKKWTYEDDIEIQQTMLDRVKNGEIPGFTLSKRYVQRGSIPRNRREIWGLLSVAQKSMDGKFVGYRIQFKPYEIPQSLPNTIPLEWKPLLAQTAKLLWRTLNWVLVYWRLILTITVVSITLISGQSEKLLDMLHKANEVQQSVDGTLDSLPAGASRSP